VNDMNDILLSIIHACLQFVIDTNYKNQTFVGFVIQLINEMLWYEWRHTDLPNKKYLTGLPGSSSADITNTQEHHAGTRLRVVKMVQTTNTIQTEMSFV
jgi:hypothetical protein